MAVGANWSRAQLLVALNLYCQIPFGRLHYGNPLIIESARLIGRTPSALAMKLVNFASLDPAITSTGRKGLAKASAADRAMWEEMQGDWQRFVVEATLAASSFGGAPPVELTIDQSDEDADFTGVDRMTQTAIRVGQGFFRRAVLSAYDYRCCITGLAAPKLLLASHIVPWRVDPSNRLNPRKGLCLSALHDRAFDAGMITIADNTTLNVSVSAAIKEDRFFQSAILAYNGKPIALPEKFRPDPAFLNYHRQHVFQG